MNIVRIDNHYKDSDHKNRIYQASTSELYELAHETPSLLSSFAL